MRRAAAPKPGDALGWGDAARVGEINRLVRGDGQVVGKENPWVEGGRLKYNPPQKNRCLSQPQAVRMCVAAETNKKRPLSTERYK